MIKLSLFLFTLFIGTWASAAVTLTAVGGVGSYDLEKKVIYGGIAGTCSTTDPAALATCDSCTSNTMTACNKTSIYPTLKLRLTLRTDKPNLSSTSTYVTMKVTSSSSSSSGGAYLSLPVVVTTGSDFTVQTTWGDICRILGEGSQCDSFTKLIGTIEVGMDAGNSGTPEAEHKVALSFRISRITGSTYDKLSSTCPVGGSIAVGESGSSNVGICDFTVYPGDEKVYVTEIRKGAASADGILTPAFGDFPFTSLMLFYRRAAGNDNGSKAAALAAITNTSEVREFGIKTVDKEVEINDNRAQNLENGVTYCFATANKDASGNIFYFTSSGLSTTNNCATPSEVVGLLDDKRCFIATATYGSPFAEEVTTLREFRNEYLLPFEWGRKFVKFYYKYSPPVAQIISESPVLKTLSWLTLGPLILWVKLVFWLGLAPALLVLLLTAIAWQRFMKLGFFAFSFNKRRAK